jgi:hypothetical protein
MVVFLPGICPVFFIDLAKNRFGDFVVDHMEITDSLPNLFPSLITVLVLTIICTNYQRTRWIRFIAPGFAGESLLNADPLMDVSS